MVSAFEETNNIEIPYKIAPRRDGDIAMCYADTSYAKEKLNWEAKYGLSEMVESAYNYVLKNKEE